MNARRPFSILLVSLFLASAVPGPGWGGGLDIVLMKNCQSACASSSTKRDSAAPRMRGGARLSGSSAPTPAVEQSWMAWVWNMLVSLYGPFYRSPSGTSLY